MKSSQNVPFGTQRAGDQERWDPGTTGGGPSVAGLWWRWQRSGTQNQISPSRARSHLPLLSPRSFEMSDDTTTAAAVGVKRPRSEEADKEAGGDRVLIAVLRKDPSENAILYVPT